MLLVPKGADQFDNAERCKPAGTAIVLPPDEVTADAVRDALRRLLEDDFVPDQRGTGGGGDRGDALAGRSGGASGRGGAGRPVI